MAKEFWIDPELRSHHIYSIAPDQTDQSFFVSSSVLQLSEARLFQVSQERNFRFHQLLGPDH